MSNEKVPNPIDEPIEDRVENLGRLLEELDEDFAALSAKLNRDTLQYQNELKQRVDVELVQLRHKIEATLADIERSLENIRVTFNERVQQEVRKVTAEEIASALTKKILVTRPANRGEQAMAVRQATAAEIRAAEIRNQKKAS